MLLKLAERSDVVIENNSTGTMDDLGLGFDDLLAVNPNIVMVSSQLMGSHGTWADWRGYGPTGQGPGGLLHLWNYADRDDPAGLGVDLPRPLRRLPRRGGRPRRARRPRPRHQRRDCTWRSRRWRRSPARSPTCSPPRASRRARSCRRATAASRARRGACIRCAGEEQWVAITCRDDADWRGLRAAMGEPDWAADPAVRRPADVPARERGGARREGRASGRVRDTKDDDRRAVPAPRRPGRADAHRHRHGEPSALRGARLRDPHRPAGARRDGARRRRVPRRPHGGSRRAGRAGDRRAHARDQHERARARRRRDRQAARHGRARDHAAGHASPASVGELADDVDARAVPWPTTC